jgi:hypothetical protein
MKSCFSITISLFLFLVGRSQKVDIVWGQEGKTEVNFKSFVQGAGSDLIKLSLDYGRRGKVTPILTRYNSNLDEVSERRIELDEDNITFKKLLSVKGKLFLFTSQDDKKSKSTTHFCQQLNMLNFNPEGKIIDLGIFEGLKNNSQSSIGLEFSKDSSKIMMFATSAFEKNKNEKYYMCVRDNNMSTLWDKTIELPYKDKFIEILDYLVTNDGKIGVLLHHFDEEITKGIKKIDDGKNPNYKTKLLMYDNENTYPTEYIVDIGNNFVTSLQFAEDNSDGLLFFGMYSKLYYGLATGYFIANFDKATKKITNKGMNSFPDALVEQIIINKQANNTKKYFGLYHWFKLILVAERENGSKDFVLEYRQEVFYKVSTYYGNGTWHNINQGYWYYEYGDIVDINIQKDGKTNIARIPKLQISNYIADYIGVKVLPYKDKLLVFYNDNDDNVDREIGKKSNPLKKFNKSVFVMGTFDKNGNVSRDFLFRNSDNKPTTAVNTCVQIDKNRIGLYAQRLGSTFSSAKDMIGILTIN